MDAVTRVAHAATLVTPTSGSWKCRSSRALRTHQRKERRPRVIATTTEGLTGVLRGGVPPGPGLRLTPLQPLVVGTKHVVMGEPADNSLAVGIDDG